MGEGRQRSRYGENWGWVVPRVGLAGQGRGGMEENGNRLTLKNPPFRFNLFLNLPVIQLSFIT